MPAPLPKLVIPPAKAKKAGKPADVPQPLWDAIQVAAKKNGVTPQVLAGIWRAESGSTFPNNAVNSSGYGGLFGTTKWDASTAEQADYAAGILRGLIASTGNLHDALLKYSGGGYYDVPGVSVPRTASQVASDRSRAAKTQAESNLGTPGLIDTQAQLSLARSTTLQDLKLQQHFNDPWATVIRDKAGNITAFGPPSTGINPPDNAVIVNGQPITQSDLNDLWSSKYANTYLDYTGKQASPADIVQTIQSGVTPYGLQTQLSTQPGFTTSPVYKQNAAKYRTAATTALGAKPPSRLIRQAVAENWDQATFQANLQALPAYQKGPEFKTNVASMNTTYKQIYGSIPPGVEETIRAHTLQGWTPAEFGTYLRQQPQYQQSPEYRQNATQLLNDLGVTVPAPVPVRRPPVGGREAREGPPVPQPPSLDVNNLLHQAGVTAAERRQLHQIWATSVNPDGSLNVSRAASLAQPIKQRLLGTAYTQANPEIQQTLGAFGEGDQSRLPKTDLQTLGEQETGHTTPAGIKLQAAFERAQQRMQGAFRGTLANPAVQNLFRPPPEDLQA